MKFFSAILILISIAARGQGPMPGPLRIGIAGLTHTHVHWIFNSAKRYPDKITIVGIAEPDGDLARRYLAQYGLSMDLVYPSLEEMLLHSNPEAVTAFNSIFQHLEVVRACAPRKVHVMVEKPLAVSLEHALEMRDLAKKHGIHLLTNYETTWYGSSKLAWSIIHEQGKIGEIRKIVAHHGHQGPMEIGVNREFLEWLTHPELNGGGAIMDFGCYGANLISWLMKGARPESVMAVTQQLKPDVYPDVDDEATIILNYPHAQAIIQASWNWPYNRKDIEVYGRTAYLKADRSSLRFQKGDSAEHQLPVHDPQAPFNDPFVYLSAVVRGEAQVEKNDLSALDLNIIVMEILEASRRSSREGKRIYLKKEN